MTSTSTGSKRPRDKIAACSSKLGRYRAALEAGTDPVLVQQWIAQARW